MEMSGSVSSNILLSTELAALSPTLELLSLKAE